MQLQDYACTYIRKIRAQNIKQKRESSINRPPRVGGDMVELENEQEREGEEEAVGC